MERLPWRSYDDFFYSDHAKISRLKLQEAVSGRVVRGFSKDEGRLRVG